jgi:hypothetical protein
MQFYYDLFQFFALDPDPSGIEELTHSPVTLLWHPFHCSASKGIVSRNSLCVEGPFNKICAFCRCTNGVQVDITANTKSQWWIHMFLGLLDPDPLVRGMDPDPYPYSDPSIIKQKLQEKPWILLFCDFFLTCYLWKMMYVPSKSNMQKNFFFVQFFCWSMM